MESKWIQPPQNSIDAIAHGMTYSDGSEFDVRLTIDGELKKMRLDTNVLF